MEKLLKLLNEYQEERDSEYRFISIEDWDFFKITSVLWTWLWAETVFSKKFLFIRRLVENNKLEMEKLEYKYQDLVYELEQSDFYKSREDFALMLLSIQDNPVEFLVSILK